MMVVALVYYTWQIPVLFNTFLSEYILLKPRLYPRFSNLTLGQTILYERKTYIKANKFFH